MSNSKKINWLSLTKKYWKEQIIFYVLTTLSCLGAFLISTNVWKKLLSKENKFLFEGKFFEKNYWVWEFSSQKQFVAVMFITVIIACLIVVVHVYYSYYFANKIATATKKRLVRKLFSLQNPHDRKKSLSILTQNVRTFSYLNIFAPNQIYYSLLDTLLVFVAVREAAKKTDDSSLIFLGIAYYFLILGVDFFFQYLVYKKDQPFQRKIKKETEKEDFLVSNRDLIIKKNLVSSLFVAYKNHLGSSQKVANKRDFYYTLAYAIPAFSLVRMAGFIFAPFGKDEGAKLAVISLVGLADSTKKMIERLKDYPYGLSAQKQINDFLQLPERDDAQKNILVLEPIKNITLKKVSFSYEENKLVLKKFDWEFHTGKINHLTGENGFGKSTIISLIIGLYQLQEGKILINNKYKLNELNLIKWREKIAYSEHKNLIENGFSTGQKQLTDLNNLFENSKSKEIFIFDEADNALDEKNQKDFRQKIEKLSKEKIVILVSH